MLRRGLWAATESRLWTVDARSIRPTCDQHSSAPIAIGIRTYVWADVER